MDPAGPAEGRQRPDAQRPEGNSQGVEENQGLHEVLDPTHKYKFMGETAVRGHGLGPGADTEGAIRGHREDPKIDVIVSDFGPSLVGALPEFTKSGRTIPALAMSDGNVLGCSGRSRHAKNPTFKLFAVSTQNDHARLAIDWAVALATGGKRPKTTHFPALTFEDSVSGKPHPVDALADGMRT